MIHDVSRDNMYVGPEDVRLFSYRGLLCYNANRGFPSSFQLSMETFVSKMAQRNPIYSVWKTSGQLRKLGDV